MLDSPLISVERTAKTKFLWAFGPFDEIAWQSGRLWTKLWAGTDLGSYDANVELSRLDPKRVMVIFGESDSIFPLEETRRFVASGGTELQSWSVANADHIQAIHHPEYAGRLARFFEVETSITPTPIGAAAQTEQSKGISAVGISAFHSLKASDLWVLHSRFHAFAESLEWNSGASRLPKK